MWNNEGFGEGFGGGTEGGGYFNSPSYGGSSSKPKSQRKAQIVMPMSVAHFYNAMNKGDTVKIGETEASMLTFVGLVRRVDLQSTVHIYEIDDMTGPCLLVKRWLGEDANDDATENILMENTYARVTGVPRKVQEDIFILGVNLRPVKDLNELTLHLLDMVRARLMLKKGNQKTTMAVSSNNLPMHGMNVDRNVGMTGAGGNMASNSLMSSLSKSQAKVLQIINACHETNGCSIQSLTEVTKLPLPELRRALEFLSDEGHIYTTIDEEHFKGTCF